MTASSFRPGISNPLAVFGWLTLGLFVVAPPGESVGLSGPYGLYDIAGLGLVLFFWPYALVLRERLRGGGKQRGGSLRGGSLPRSLKAGLSIYLATVLVVPTIGLALFEVPTSWYWGDLRWFHVILATWALGLVYASQPETLLRDSYRLLWVLVLAQVPFLLSQVPMDVFGSSPSVLLEFWHVGGDVYGEYGQNSGRYAASFRNPSGLALLGGVAFLTGGFSLARGRAWSVTLLLFGGLYMLAAGNRAMLFGGPVALLAVWGWARVDRRHMARLSRNQVTAIAAGVGLAILAAYWLDLGQIATGDRLANLIAWLEGEGSFEEASRRAEAWSMALESSAREWSPIGTLVNPSHALGGQAIDSYYVLAFAQAGPLILAAYLVVMAFMVRFGVGAFVEGRWGSALVLGPSLALLISSFTQNTLTGLAGRALFMLAVLGVVGVFREQMSGSRKAWGMTLSGPSSVGEGVGSLEGTTKGKSGVGMTG